MAALLVALAIMAVTMTVAMPTWRQMAQREKESELVFRGEQYARAVGLFQRRAGPGVLPPSVDVLVEQRLLRKKYKDPTNGQDFLLIPGAVAAGTQAQLQAAQTTTQTAGGRGAATGRGGAQASAPTSPSTTTGRGATSGASTSPATPYVVQGGPFGTNVPGGVVGVVSKNTDVSLRLYNGRGHYNEWEFRYTAPPTAQPSPENPNPNQVGAPLSPGQRGGTTGGRGAGQRGQTAPIGQGEGGRAGAGARGAPQAPGGLGGPRGSVPPGR